MALPSHASEINISDKIADTIKTTAGYFTNGDGTLGGEDIFTGSLASSNELYYFNVNHKTPTDTTSEVQFSVTFGHAAGSGSNTYGDSTTNANTLNGETQAIYKQFTNLLLQESEASGGFRISANAGGDGILAVDTRDEYFYALVGKREKFKDRFNKKSWTLSLSGSDTAGLGNQIFLTDDSSTVAAVATPGGPRHNIVSGTLGNVVAGHTYADKTYGWFYPEMGVMLFSGVELSASIPGLGGAEGTEHVTASFDTDLVPLASSGFSPNINSTANSKNALRLANCMRNVNGNALRLRSEEDQTQENYFCRIKAAEYNFSANPTFTSGSKNKIRNLDMHGNPQSFITGVGLYNSAGQLLAIAKLSSPLKKNFASEATVKVKLTY
jgi:hypothetical protein|tara:strand:+ start:10633 stop:11781 length:1149 start_codon:yes stop_codon:yes gene_type:complete